MCPFKSRKHVMEFFLYKKASTIDFEFNTGIKNLKIRKAP
jgi:hypothetical protein